MHLNWHNHIAHSKNLHVGWQISALGKNLFSNECLGHNLALSKTKKKMYLTNLQEEIKLKKQEDRYRVLILDISDYQHVILSELPIANEIEITLCHNVNEAISCCSTEKYDLIVVNNDLNALAGIELANIFQGLYTDHLVEFIFLLDEGAKLELGDFQTSKVDILCKPLNPTILNLKIQNHILRRNAIRDVQKSRDQLEKLSQKLENKTRSHTKSIEYAKLIQERILPQIDYLENKFPQSFIVYQPKEIIGGDFYMICEVNSRMIMVTADCTGHGVPGAMLSMVGYGFIKSIIHENRIFEPGNILTLLNEKIKNFFGRDSEVATHGMDVSIVSFRTDTKMLEYASSRRPILLTEGEGVIELKGDNVSIGDEIAENHTFQTYTYPVSGPFWIYQFSDGITDQFGGINNKKFGKKTFKALIASIKDFTAEEQKNKLLNAFTQWKGNYKQTDDITVVGKYFSL